MRSTKLELASVLCAILLDGTPFKGRQMIAAIGVAHNGEKTVLGLRERATENTTVVRELLEDLASTGPVCGKKSSAVRELGERK